MEEFISLCLISHQVFKVQHIAVKAGSAPLPAFWGLEVSRDPSSGFRAIRYYTADQEECLTYLGVDPVNKEMGQDPLCLLRSNISWKEDESVSNSAGKSNCSSKRLEIISSVSQSGTQENPVIPATNLLY